MPFFPAHTNLSYFLRYTNSGIGYVLSSNIVVYPEIFTNLTAIGNGKPVVVNPYLLNAGVPAYSDRSHAWDQVPTIIQGGQFVKFGQDDKTSAILQVSFTRRPTAPSSSCSTIAWVTVSAAQMLPLALIIRPH